MVEFGAKFQSVCMQLFRGEPTFKPKVDCYRYNTSSSIKYNKPLLLAVTFLLSTREVSRTLTSTPALPGRRFERYMRIKVARADGLDAGARDSESVA